MLKVKEIPPTEVGVIVGRFQVPEIHEGQLDLIKSVCDKHDKVIIFLGLSPLKGTLNNPLDYEMRKQMIQDVAPEVIIQYIKDQRSDEKWSKDLDRQIKDLIGPAQKVTLYGSRDSFISHYKGGFTTCELEPDRIISGTEMRKRAAAKAKNDPKFRAGAIWQAYNKYPTNFATVDVAILSENGKSVLLVRKPAEELYRFCGGFADPNSISYEADARREVQEETGVEISEPKYIGSMLVDDWRYRGEVDKIKTMLFVAKYQFGKVEGADDVAEARWFEIDKLFESDIVEEHRKLLAMFKNHLEPEALKPF